MRTVLQLLGAAVFGAVAWAAVQFAMPAGMMAGQAASGAPERAGPVLAETDAPAAGRRIAEPARSEAAGAYRAVPHVSVLPVGRWPAERSEHISGLPGYGSLSFLLPKDSRGSAGEIALVFESETPANVNATLRMSVNGQRRKEVLLAAGRERRTVIVPLVPDDLKRNRLRLSFAVTGVSTTAVCGSHIGNALVALLPETHLRLVTARPLSTTEDEYRVAGGVVGLRWPADAAGGSDANSADIASARLLDVAARALRAGINVAFHSEAQPEAIGFTATAEELAQMIAEARPWKANGASRDWPLEFVGQIGGSSLQHFNGSHSWRYNFDLADLPDARVPGTLDYGLTLSQIGRLSGEGPGLARQAGQGWLVAVTMNGRLLESYTAGPGKLRRQVRIPEGLTGFANQLEISVGRSFDVDGICNDGPPLIAELAGDTALLPGEDEAGTDAGKLARLAGAAPVLSPAGLATLTAPDAQAAAELLADIPQPITVVGGEGDGEGAVRLRIADLAALSGTEEAAREGWIYLRREGEPYLVPLEEAERTGGLSDYAIGLLLRAKLRQDDPITINN